MQYGIKTRTVRPSLSTSLCLFQQCFAGLHQYSESFPCEILTALLHQHSCSQYFIPSERFFPTLVSVLSSAFYRMRSKGSRFTLGVWGLRVCSLDVAFVVATVRNRSQPFATVRAIPVWPCLWEVLQRWSFLEVSDVWLLRFAWQAWHFVTFRRVL